MKQTNKRTAAANYVKLQVGSCYAVTIHNIEIALFKLTNGEIRAIENRSPNPRGGLLSDGLVSGEYIFDAVYDWKISLADGKVQAPDEGQVRTFPVEVEDGIIYVIV